MTESEAISITRNPHGFNADQRREARLLVCDRLESWRDAYENMRQFAIQNGLDVTCYYGPIADEKGRDSVPGD